MRAAVLLLLLATSLPARAADQLVAVLPLDATNAKIADADRIAVEEMLRTVAGTELQPLGYTVLTGETTLLVLRDNGIDAAKACEASCALEAARELQARLFLSGSIVTSEGSHIANVRLFDSQAGRILASTELEGDSVRSLRQQFKAEAPSFFRRGLAEARALPAPAPAGTDGRIGAKETFEVGGAGVVVKFTSQPDGALVLVDGAVLCQSTPCSKVAPEGVHEVTLQKEDYETLREKATFARGASLAFTLVPQFASLAVRTEPAGLAVSVDGATPVATPAALRLAPGSHELLVKDRCFADAGERVTVARGDSRELTIAAQERLAGLNVLAQDEQGDDVEADVSIDGRRMGRAPATFKVPACAKRVELLASGGRGWSGPLTLVERETATVTARLRVLKTGIRVGVDMPVPLDYETSIEPTLSTVGLRLVSDLSTYTCTVAAQHCDLSDVIAGDYSLEVPDLSFEVPVRIGGSGTVQLTGGNGYRIGNIAALIGFAAFMGGFSILEAHGFEDPKSGAEVGAIVGMTLGGILGLVTYLTVVVVEGPTSQPAAEGRGDVTVLSRASTVPLRVRVGHGPASGLSLVGGALDLRIGSRLLLSAVGGWDGVTSAGGAISFGPRSAAGGMYTSVSAVQRFDDTSAWTWGFVAGWEFPILGVHALRLGGGLAYAGAQGARTLSIRPDVSFALGF